MAFAPSTTTASRTGSPDWITASVFWMLGLEIEGDLRLAHQVARRVDEGACPRDLDLHRLELAYLGACIRADACPERGGDVLQRAFRRAERASRQRMTARRLCGACSPEPTSSSPRSGTDHGAHDRPVGQMGDHGHDRRRASIIEQHEAGRLEQW